MEPKPLGETPRVLNFDPQKMTTVEKSTDPNPFSLANTTH